MALMIKLAVAGAGITFGMEESLSPGDGTQGAHPCPRGLLPVLRRLLPLLSEPQKRRAQIARACRACTMARTVTSTGRSWVVVSLSDRTRTNGLVVPVSGLYRADPPARRRDCTCAR
ncbi:hypothetical protein MES4922_300031 [Mesorhizobium ventifaucium]|uniref:Uncharacterized protein n=1 Tax=Mesorhizobium ventifaucium TaxID=666020 RepID=A0ABN8K0B7_9HYPH|nr:hypothetical protein MES4922_300031 [Mesorhizobium ventifaucium]